MKYVQEVEAVIWQPGMELPHVKQHDPQIVYSRDEKLFYLTGLDILPGEGRTPFRGASEWLSVEADPETGKFNVYPFAFWDVKSGRSETATPESPLVQRYLQLVKVQHPPLPRALVKTEAHHDWIYPGDYVVTYPNGVVRGVPKAEFEATFKPCSVE